MELDVFAKSSGMFFTIIACGLLPVALAFLAGHCLYRVKHSPRSVSERFFLYPIICFAFSALAVFPLAVLPHGGTPFVVLWHCGVMAVLFLIFMPHATPERRWPAYAPGLLVAAFFVLFAGIFAHKEYDRATRSIQARSKNQDRYDEVMKQLSAPERRIVPNLALAEDDFEWISLSPETKNEKFLLPVPIPAGHVYDPLPKQALPFFPTEFLRFRDPLAGGEIIAVVRLSTWGERYIPRRSDNMVLVPFLAGSVFEHFADVPNMYRGADALYNYFREDKEKKPIYMSDSHLTIPADLDDKRIPRVVQYDDTLVASRFPCELNTKSDTGRKVRTQLDFLYAAGATTAFSMECLVFADSGNAAADHGMLLAWMNALFKNTKEKSAGQIREPVIPEQ